MYKKLKLHNKQLMHSFLWRLSQMDRLTLSWQMTTHLNFWVLSPKLLFPFCVTSCWTGTMFDRQEECELRDLFCNIGPFFWCSWANKAALRPVFCSFLTSLFKLSNRPVPKCTFRRANIALILYQSDLLLTWYTQIDKHAHTFAQLCCKGLGSG